MVETSLSLPFAEVRQRLTLLPRGIREHVERVVAEAVSLARCQGVDPVAAEFTALAHDLFRVESPGALRERAKAYGVNGGRAEQRTPVLLHGPVTAEWLRRELGVADEDVLNAIRYHTSGRPGMSRLEMVLFVADKAEPGRHEYPHREETEQLACHDIEGAVLRLLGQRATSLRAKGLPVVGDMQATLEWLRSRRA